MTGYPGTNKQISCTGFLAKLSPGFPDFFRHKSVFTRIPKKKQQQQTNKQTNKHKQTKTKNIQTGTKNPDCFDISLDFQEKGKIDSGIPRFLRKKHWNPL